MTRGLLRSPPFMPQHVGIVACSAEGAALCYRILCVEGAQFLGPHAHPEVSLHTQSLADYVQCLDRGDMHGVAELMLSSARKLLRNRRTAPRFLIPLGGRRQRRLGAPQPSAPTS